MQSYDAMMQPFFVYRGKMKLNLSFPQKGWKYPKEQGFIQAKREQPHCGAAPFCLLIDI
jgi:hypothetical protein